MKRIHMIVGVILITVLAACGSQEKQDETSIKGNSRQVTHALGETSISETPERIVALELGVTETVAALGIVPVGVADDDKPERIAASTMERIEGYTSVGARSEPSLELIRTLKPDLIIADRDRHKDIYEELSQIAPTIAVVNDTADYEEVLAATTTIGEALNLETETTQLLARHLETVKTFAAKIDGNERVLQAEYTSSNLFGAPTSSYFMPSFLTSLGFEYALQDDTETSQDLTIEQLLKIDPDTLFITKNEGDASVVDQLKNDRLWGQLSAVKEGRVFEVDHNDWSRRRSIMAIDERIEELTQIFSEQNEQTGSL